MKEEMETIKLRSGNQLARENYLLLNKSKAQILNILLNTEEKMEDLQSQLKAKEEAEREFIKYLEAEKDRLAREVSQIYEDSLGKTKLVNEDIFNEVNNVLSKYNEILSKGENK